MFLARKQIWIVAGVVFFAASGAFAKVDIKNFLSVGLYKLTSGPRDICDRLSVDDIDLKDPLILNAKYIFSLEDSYQRFPSEDHKDCTMNRRDKVKMIDPQTVVLTFDREEECKSQTKIQQRMEARLKKGEVQITNTALGRPPYTCVWKWRGPAVNEKK